MVRQKKKLNCGQNKYALRCMWQNNDHLHSIRGNRTMPELYAYLCIVRDTFRRAGVCNVQRHQTDEYLLRMRSARIIGII
jgi:hypothetical protein